MQMLARSVLRAHLAPAEGEEPIPRRLLASRFGQVFAFPAASIRTAQVAGPARRAESLRIRSVRVEVVRVRFDAERRLTRVEPFVPAVEASLVPPRREGRP
jgi:hypothetical protein